MSKPTIEEIALAYTAKSSDASTPEQFLADYEQNLELFKKEFASREKPWLY